MGAEKKNRISDIVPMLLFLVFTLTALGIVLVSVQIYRHIVQEANAGYETSTAEAYLREKFRAHDEKGNIRADEFKGHDAVVMEEMIMGVPYVTYIYTSDGYLRELFIEESEAELSDEGSGTPILEMKDLRVESDSDRLIHVVLTDKDDETADTYLSVQSSGKDDQ